MLPGIGGTIAQFPVILGDLRLFERVMTCEAVGRQSQLK